MWCLWERFFKSVKHKLLLIALIRLYLVFSKCAFIDSQKNSIRIKVGFFLKKDVFYYKHWNSKASICRPLVDLKVILVSKIMIFEVSSIISTSQ